MQISIKLIKPDIVYKKNNIEGGSITTSTPPYHAVAWNIFWYLIVNKNNWMCLTISFYSISGGFSSIRRTTWFGCCDSINNGSQKTSNFGGNVADTILLIFIAGNVTTTSNDVTELQNITAVAWQTPYIKSSPDAYWVIDRTINTRHGVHAVWQDMHTSKMS